MSEQSVTIEEEKIDENTEEKLVDNTEVVENVEDQEEQPIDTAEVAESIEATNIGEEELTSKENFEETNEPNDKPETENEPKDENEKQDEEAVGETEIGEAPTDGAPTDEAPTDEAPTDEVPTEKDDLGLQEKKKQAIALLPKSRAIVEDDDLMFQFSSPDISFEGDEEEAEIEDEIEIALELKLDRNKLIDSYKKMLLERSQSTRLNQLLNQQVFEYFKNKNIGRASIEDNQAQSFEITQKYHSCLYDLDRLIPKKKRITEECHKLITSLNNEEKYIRSEYEKNLEILNTRLRETGVTFQSSKSGQFLSDKAVERLIHRMTVIRNIIHEERYSFIKTQAKMVEVEKKSKELEDLGDGYMMTAYEQLRTETQSLGEKIEECDNELSKLRIRCYSDTQILAHIREKEFMLSNTIRLQVEINKDLLNDLVDARMNMNEKKSKLDDLRKKFKKMRENCGLLDKPLMLRNYDATVEKIEQLKLLIKEYRQNNDKIKSQQDTILLEMNAMLLMPTESEMFDENLKKDLALLDKEIYPKVFNGVPRVKSFFKKEWDSRTGKL